MELLTLSWWFSSSLVHCAECSHTPVWQDNLPISKGIIAHSNPEFHFYISQQQLHCLMKQQEQSICAHGTHNTAGEGTACSKYLCTKKPYTASAYPFWRSACKYKHKRLLCLVELKGQPKSKWLPHKSDLFAHVWASLHVYRLRDDASPRGKVVSPSWEKAAWAVAQFLFLASSTSLPHMFLTRITWEWISHVVVRLLYHARVSLAVCHSAIIFYKITRLDFSVSIWYIWAKQHLSGSAPGWKGAEGTFRQTLGSQLFIYFFSSNMLKYPLPSKK